MLEKINFCECACGQNVKFGNRFIHGHNPPPNKGRKIKRTFHLCFCGCGQLTVNNYFRGHKPPQILNFCLCGCGKECKNKFVNGGHNNIGKHPNLGRKHTEEENRKNSLSNKGKIPWNRGLTKETDNRVCRAEISNETKRKNRRRTIAQHHPLWGENQIEEHAKELELEKVQYLCECNCGRFAKLGNKFIYGHQRRGQSAWSKGKTKATDKRIASAKYGHSQSDETKQKLRIFHTGLKQTDETIAKRFSKSGKNKFPYVCVNGEIVKMRSSWEILYAKYLDAKEIIWFYEPKQFKLSNGHRYIPDFYLPELNEWHEIKGWMPLSSVEKMDLFRKEYPKFGFKLIMQNDLIRLDILEG